MSDKTIFLTDAAIEAFHKNIEGRGTPNAYIRLGVKGGNCSGYSYVIQYEDIVKDTDLQFVFSGVCVVVDPKSIVFLNGSTIDFVVSLLESKFVFNNPNADKQCGCGISFSIKDK